jgi:CRISPR/Cas system CMR subunit Cmr4 (Cas7 group RAMP superfamily)
VQRNKNSRAPDRKLQSELRKNVVDAVKQAVEKLLKAELLRGEHEEDAANEGAVDDEDKVMADKIQAEVVGSDTKADGHALAGGNMDEGDNFVRAQQLAAVILCDNMYMYRRKPRMLMMTTMATRMQRQRRRT